MEEEMNIEVASNNEEVKIIDLKTERRLPPSLRGTIYEVMLKAISEEIALWRMSCKERYETFYNIDKMGVNDLIKMSEYLKCPYAALDNEDVTFAREEVRSIPFKIINKGTYSLYRSFIYAVKRRGDVFTFAKYDTRKVKLIEDIFKEATANAASDQFHLPFFSEHKIVEIESLGDYPKLDSGLILDSMERWKLDTISFSVAATNYLGVEYYIDTLIEKNGKKYLMTNEYLNYLKENTNFYRRVKEVICVGAQVGIQTKIGEVCDCSEESEYTVPSLEIKAVTRSDVLSLIESCKDIAYVEFGIGKNEVASFENPDVSFPENLAVRVSSDKLIDKTQLENSSYYGAIGNCQGKHINNYILYEQTVSSEKDSLTFSIPFFPIQEGTVKLEFRLSAVKSIKITDDGFGKFILPNGSGVIDYDTGECSITFLESLYVPEDAVLTATDYFTKLDMEITEMGLRSKDGDLIGYATFPPFELKSSSYHFCFMYLIKK